MLVWAVVPRSQGKTTVLRPSSKLSLLNQFVPNPPNDVFKGRRKGALGTNWLILLIAWLFASHIHLIPGIEEFQKFGSLLLNLYLLLNNSNIKQSIFEEVQSTYGSQSLKLIKAAATRWLSYRKTTERVPDRSQSLVAALLAIYVRKHESVVRGLQDDLVDLSIYLYLQLAQNLKTCLNKLLQSNRKSIYKVNYGAKIFPN